MWSLKTVKLKWISTHSLTRRLTNVLLWFDWSKKNFNSQPHKEADCIAIIADSIAKLFQLTASQGGWHMLVYSIISVEYFNSQPHKEADYVTFWASWDLSNFNSQPHKEADSNFRQKHIYPKLIFLLIIHISLIFYSNHHILNYFSCKLYVFPGANVLEYFCELTFRTIILRYL